MSRRSAAPIPCLHCGSSFRPYSGQRFCSRACGYANVRERPPRLGGRYVAKNGYVFVRVDRRRYELEHRLVAAKMLGRSLTTDEQVHHINGVKTDNRPENLQVLSNRDHQILHDWPRTKSQRLAFTCEQCGKPYERKKHLAGVTRFCSGSCRSTFVSNARWAKHRALASS